MDYLGGRVGSIANFRMDINDEYPADALVQSRRRGAFANRVDLTASDGGGMVQVLPLDPQRLAAAEDGRQRLEVHVKVNVIEGAGPRSAPPTVTRDIKLDIPWTLLPADQPTVKAVYDPSLQAAVEKSIGSVQLRMSHPSQFDQMGVELRIAAPPVALAYRVFVRSGDQEWPAGTFSVPRNFRTSWGLGGEVKGLTADRVDVIFRPDATLAANSIELREYWNDEVVVKDVAIYRPAARPAASAETSPASTPAP
jgi:hypothetical protein